MLTDIEKLKQIIADWASKLPYKCNVYVFGSRLKGTAKNDSDLDIAIELLEIEEPWLLWFGVHEKWEKHLSNEIGLKVDLHLYEGKDSENLEAYLSEASILLYSSKEP